MASFWESPIRIRLALRQSLAMDHLFYLPTQQFRHAQVKLTRQPFNLLVGGIRQLHFGTFHGPTLQPKATCEQGQF